MIQFNANNRPVCNPQNKTECAINEAAIQDLWDALACLSEKYVLTEVKCFDFAGLVNEDTVFINKSEVAAIDNTCLISFLWNGVVYFPEGTFGNDHLQYVITERVSDFMIKFVDENGDPLFVGSDDEPCDIRITVFVKEKVLDLMNSCEPQDNCRDN